MNRGYIHGNKTNRNEYNPHDWNDPSKPDPNWRAGTEPLTGFARWFTISLPFYFGATIGTLLISPILLMAASDVLKDEEYGASFLIFSIWAAIIGSLWYSAKIQIRIRERRMRRYMD